MFRVDLTLTGIDHVLIPEWGNQNKWVFMRNKAISDRGVRVRDRQGWSWWLARVAVAALLFESVTGPAITFLPFHVAVEWAVLLHTAVGCLMLLPWGWYSGRHWSQSRHSPASAVVLLGYVTLVGLTVCCISGTVISAQGIWGNRTQVLWREVHLLSTWVLLAGAVPHIGLVFWKALRNAHSIAA